MADVVNVTALFKDMYPAPGERVKQWVVDMRREADWEHKTAPRVFVPNHRDNTNADCRNEGPTPLPDLEHDCCSTCNELHEHALTYDETKAWLEEKAKRPPIEQDRAKLSDEVAPDDHLRPHPALTLTRSK